MADLRFALLGPLAVTADDVPVEVPGRAERALLVLLLLSVGRPVPAATLIDRLWVDTALPRDPVNALQLRVSKLRRALAGTGADLVQRAGSGYLLAAEPECVDAELFVRRVRTVRTDLARADGPTLAHLEQYDAALGLWRGPALADVADEAWAAGEVVRLEELRTAAYAERAQVHLGLGRVAEAITDLEPLVAADPTQEALAGLLMLALYRAGRQAEALEVFTRTRTLLDEELGIEPSASLRSLHERVLRQDSSLGADSEFTPPRPAAARPQPPPSVSPPTDDPRSGGEVPEAAARRSAALRGNLPARLVPLVGREAELDAAHRLLVDTRLLSLLGPGGAGKTSLGLHLAAVALESHPDRYPDGAFLVRLAPARTSAEVPLALAEALGVPQDGGGVGSQVRDRLVQFLSTKRLLLLVDNCEHVVDAAADLVDELLARCPDVSVVATSREALAVPGEVQVLVGPLAAPEPEADADAIHASPAVQLLLQRVGAVRPTLQPAADDLRAAARIARALDGMPLALELAAARVTTLSLVEIADRLDQRFALLTGGARTAEARQRTLKATVDWSFDLLTEGERRVFSRLAVFHGGWDLRAAEAVLSDPDLDGNDVLHAVGRLVEQSLVLAEPGTTTRYRMLETLREYAAERLAVSGSSVDLHLRHARHYAELAREHAEGLRGDRHAASLRVLRAEHSNIRAALDWFTGPGDRLDEGLELAGRLGLFWHQGRHLEGREVLRSLLARTGGSPGARATALQALSLVERPRACLVHPHPACAAAARESLEVLEALGDEQASALSRVLLAVEGVPLPTPETEQLLVRAEAQFERSGDRWGSAVTGFVRLETALRSGERESALRWARTTVATFRELGDLWGLSAVLYHLGWGLRQFGDHEQAARTLEEAVDVARRAGVDNTVQWALADLGITQLHLGHEQAALDAFGRAEAVSVRVGDRAGSSLAGYGRAMLALHRADWAVALDLYSAAVVDFEQLATPVMTASARLGRARAWEGLGDHDAADEEYAAVRLTATGAGEPALLAAACEGLARLALARGETDPARELWVEASTVRARGSRPAPPVEARDLVGLREAFGAVPGR